MNRCGLRAIDGKYTAAPNPAGGLGTTSRVEAARVRRATVADVEVLTAAPWSGGLPEKHAERFARGARDEVVYLVALVEGAVVGHLVLKWDGPDGAALRAKLAPCAEIEDFLVAPDYRSRGVGTALLDTAARLTAERGVTRLGLAVGVENNRARALYERAGFAEVDIPPFDVRWHYRTADGALAWAGERCRYLMKPVNVDEGTGEQSDVG